jgi:hypothetical protein
MVGVRVFCPETKLPPTVLQLRTKFVSEEEPKPFRTVSGKVQVRVLGGAMTVMGGGFWTTDTLVLVGHIVVPLTVTEYVPGITTLIGFPDIPFDQVYCGKLPPDTVSVEVSPGQNGVLDAAMVGVGFNPTVTLPVPVQPYILVTVTV